MFEKLKETVTDAVDSVSESVSNITQVDIDDRFDDIFFDLEHALLQNNVAVSAVDAIREEMRDQLTGEQAGRGQVEAQVITALREALEKLLREGEPVNELVGDTPYVIAFTGVNGSGKTTTLAKIAHALQQQGKSLVLAAADTYRAASIEQLEEHAAALDSKIIKHEYESDPAAVAYDAVQHAESEGHDVVLIDTAGRLHSNANLMGELAKLIRVNDPNHTFFIGESTTGNDCVEQAQEFKDNIGFDGTILTKADVDDNGGAAISISHATDTAIHYLGTGQDYDDLEPFDKQALIDDITPQP